MSEIIKGITGQQSFSSFYHVAWMQSRSNFFSKGFFGGTKIEISNYIKMTIELFTNAAILGNAYSSKKNYDIAKWALVQPGGDPDFSIELMKSKIDEKFNLTPDPKNIFDLVLNYLINYFNETKPSFQYSNKTKQDFTMGKLNQKVPYGDDQHFIATEMDIIEGFCFGLSMPKIFNKLHVKSDKKIEGLMTEIFISWAEENNKYVYDNLK